MKIAKIQWCGGWVRVYDEETNKDIFTIDIPNDGSKLPAQVEQKAD